MNEDTKIQKQAIGVNQAKQKSIYNYVNKTADLAYVTLCHMFEIRQ